MDALKKLYAEILSHACHRKDYLATPSLFQKPIAEEEFIAVLSKKYIVTDFKNIVDTSALQEERTEPMTEEERASWKKALKDFNTSGVDLFAVDRNKVHKIICEFVVLDFDLPKKEQVERRQPGILRKSYELDNSVSLRPKEAAQAEADADRFLEVSEAISEAYRGDLPIPIHWVEEYNDLLPKMQPDPQSEKEGCCGGVGCTICMYV